MHPHLSLMSKNSIEVTELPEKTQKLIAKFNAETDEDKRDAIDESIFGQLEDFIEDKNKKAKMEKTKEAREAEKKAIADKKKIDVSAAPTATPAADPAATPAAAPKKERSALDGILGRK